MQRFQGCSHRVSCAVVRRSDQFSCQLSRSVADIVSPYCPCPINDMQRTHQVDHESRSKAHNITMTRATDDSPPNTTANQGASLENRTNGQSNDEQSDATSDNNDSDANNPAETRKLYKSKRFKGYLAIALASVINYQAAFNSGEPLNLTAVPASPTQQNYAKTVALVSATITSVLVLIHLDRVTPLTRVWSAFVAKTEQSLILFLMVWWSVATIVQTSVRGIAGDGKEQYNLYFSTWVCCYTLFWYVDLFVNTAQNPNRISSESLQLFYQDIPKSQYQWLLFVSAITSVPSGAFIIVEIFRETTTLGSGTKDANGVKQLVSIPSTSPKSSMEVVLEGFCLFSLMVGWIPSVIVATTPGGFGSLLGNAYFFTWMTTVMVMETVLWYIHDLRGQVHKAWLASSQEYQHHQEQVLQREREKHADLMEEEPKQEEHVSMTWSPQTPYEYNGDYPDSPIEDDGDGGFRHENDDDDNSSVLREMKLKHTNSEEYFENLQDILE